MLINFLLLAGFVAATLITLARYRRNRRLSWGDRLLGAALPLIVYLLIASFFCSLYQAPFWGWNGARLAPVAAMWDGEPLYATRNAGSVQTTLYPPFSAVAFALAGLFGEPSSAMIAGSLLAHLYYFLPVLYLCMSDPGNRGLGAVLFFFFTTVSLNFYGLDGSASRIHADAPALGFGLASCAALAQTHASPRARFALASVLMWLSIWSKQLLLPLVIVLPLWVILAQGRRAALQLSLWLGLGGLISVGLLAVFGTEGLFFNTVLIPKAMPWIRKAPFNLAYVFMELLTYLLPIILIVLGCAVLLLKKDPVSQFPAWLLRNTWTLPLAAALILVPSCVLGRVKVGGALNNLSYTLYFALAAAAMIILRLASLWSRRPAGGEFDTFKRLAALAGIVVAFYGFGSILQLRLHLLVPVRNENRLAYEYLLNHPGEGVYFPGQPLAHVLAESSLPHFSLAVYDRDTQTPYPVGPQQIQAHVPSQLSRICVGDDFRKESAHLLEAHFPDFAERRLEGHFWCVERAE